MKNKFYVIDTEETGEYLEAAGSFDSVEDAETYLKTQAKENFLDADKSLRDLGGEDWAKPVMIVKVVKTVQQCPRAAVTVELKDVKCET